MCDVSGIGILKIFSLKSRFLFPHHVNKINRSMFSFFGGVCSKSAYVVNVFASHIIYFQLYLASILQVKLW